MFVKLWCHAFVECGFWHALSTVYTLDCVQYTVTVFPISRQWRMLFYSNDGAIFDVLFFILGLQLSYVLFLSRDISVFFFVFFRKTFFVAGGNYTFRSLTLLDCIFLTDSNFLPLFSSVAPLCFQDNLTVVLVWQVFNHNVLVWVFWCICRKRNGSLHLNNDCTLILPTLSMV